MGRIVAGEDAGTYVRVVGDPESGGGFLILVRSSREGGGGHDDWVAGRAELARFFAVPWANRMVKWGHA